MYSSFALGALALTSLVTAIPLEKKEISYGNRGDAAAGWQAAQSYGPWGPVASTVGAPPVATYTAAPGAASAYPPPPPPAQSSGAYPPSGPPGGVSLPLPNGFPNIVNPSQQLTDINNAAHGTLSNRPPPATGPSADTLTSLRLVAFNELFEVFYFTELLYNVTSNVAGYRFQDNNLRQTVINALTAVVAQEELHALNANGALKTFNAGPIQACKYNSPVSDFKSAIGLASTFTDVVMGVLQDIATVAGKNGDVGNIRGFAASLGNEGEQNGYYRSLLGKIPSGLPFASATSREFAFSALNQNFIVPGSCPNSNTIALPIFGALNVLVDDPNIQPKDQTLKFSFNGGSKYKSAEGLSLVYVNQQNAPVVLPITGATVQNGVVTFSANFPFSQFLMNGLTIAAVTKGAGPFSDVNAVAAATLYGPGLIEVN